MENQPAGQLSALSANFYSLTWEVGRAWTCMPSLHIQPYCYQPNQRWNIYHSKGSKAWFNLSGSRFKRKILKSWKNFRFFAFLLSNRMEMMEFWCFILNSDNFWNCFQILSSNGFEWSWRCRILWRLFFLV